MLHIGVGQLGGKFTLANQAKIIAREPLYGLLLYCITTVLEIKAPPPFKRGYDRGALISLRFGEFEFRGALIYLRSRESEFWGALIF